MGQSRNHTASFLREHPTCCFCGGNAPATSIDHQPARTIFLNRAWPESYEFPACNLCNADSSTSELVAGLVTRLGLPWDDVPSEREQGEFAQHVQGVHNNARSVLPGLTMTPQEVRGWLRSRNLVAPPNTLLTDIPVVRLPPEAVRALRVFGRKLGLALHYKHTGMIVPLEGGVAVQIHTNERLHFDGPLPAELSKHLSNRPILRRTGKSLDDQFSYVYAVTDDRQIGVYYCGFRKSVALFLLVAHNSAILEEMELDPWYHPNQLIP